MSSRGVSLINSTSVTEYSNLEIRLDAANSQQRPTADLSVRVLLAGGRTAMFFTAPGVLGVAASLGTPAAFRSMQAAPPGFSLSLIRQGPLTDNGIDIGDILSHDVRPLTIAP